LHFNSFYLIDIYIQRPGAFSATTITFVSISISDGKGVWLYPIKKGNTQIAFF